MSNPEYTAKTLPPLLTAQERLAVLCYDCGAEGKVYHGHTLVCVKCYLARDEGCQVC